MYNFFHALYDVFCSVLKLLSCPEKPHFYPTHPIMFNLLCSAFSCPTLDLPVLPLHCQAISAATTTVMSQINMFPLPDNVVATARKNIFYSLHHTLSHLTLDVNKPVKTHFLCTAYDVLIPVFTLPQSTAHSHIVCTYPVGLNFLFLTLSHPFPLSAEIPSCHAMSPMVAAVLHHPTFCPSPCQLHNQHPPTFHTQHSMMSHLTSCTHPVSSHFFVPTLSHLTFCTHPGTSMMSQFLCPPCPNPLPVMFHFLYMYSLCCTLCVPHLIPSISLSHHFPSHLLKSQLVMSLFLAAVQCHVLLSILHHVTSHFLSFTLSIPLDSNTHIVLSDFLHSTMSFHIPVPLPTLSHHT